MLYLSARLLPYLNEVAGLTIVGKHDSYVEGITTLARGSLEFEV